MCQEGSWSMGRTQVKIPIQVWNSLRLVIVYPLNLPYRIIVKIKMGVGSLSHGCPSFSEEGQNPNMIGEKCQLLGQCVLCRCPSSLFSLGKCPCSNTSFHATKSDESVTDGSSCPFLWWGARLSTLTWSCCGCSSSSQIPWWELGSEVCELRCTCSVPGKRCQDRGQPWTPTVHLMRMKRVFQLWELF